MPVTQLTVEESRIHKVLSKLEEIGILGITVFEQTASYCPGCGQKLSLQKDGTWWCETLSCLG